MHVYVCETHFRQPVLPRQFFHLGFFRACGDQFRTQYLVCVSVCVCVCVSHILRNKKCQERALYTLQLLVWPILVLVVEPVFASVRHSQTFNPLRTI